MMAIFSPIGMLNKSMEMNIHNCHKLMIIMKVLRLPMVNFGAKRNLTE